ncbi:ty3-gypsy retrotransposon protein [Cucumis melo var. makuwa]|uniref:Ty3-gypsy retrotransposon protein n=1 Tax=Cucumis melo var. makuwa TaxID=1194695 RepID=A0A5A7TG20_CUCMM|nr:ty3-gypsy retrotransposon protein [Cucumis melo var. makuwa]
MFVLGALVPVGDTLVPKKARFFIWKVILDRVNTVDRLVRRRTSLITPFCCMLCQNVEEDLDHLSWECHFARVVWSSFLSKFGVSFVESVLRDTFVTELELVLQAEVVSRWPQTLEECMKEAQLVNDHNLVLKLARAKLGVPKANGGESSTTKTQGGSEKGIQQFRARLDRGLRFRCNEKYSHGHQCKVKEKRKLMLFILNEEESTVEGDITEGKDEEKVELKQLDITEGAEIKFKAITCFTSKGTMKLKGHVKGKEVIVLIDRGATHNFIHQALVEEKKILIEKGSYFGVTIGDGTRCKGKGICRKVELRLNKMTIVVDFLAVELGKVDVVLGMQWLDTTGTMKVHWPSLTMMFWVGEKQIVLKGDPSFIRAECSLKIIEKTWGVEDQGFLLEWQNYDLEAEDDYGEE